MPARLVERIPFRPQVEDRAWTICGGIELCRRRGRHTFNGERLEETSVIRVYARVRAEISCQLHARTPLAEPVVEVRGEHLKRIHAKTVIQLIQRTHLPRVLRVRF